MSPSSGLGSPDHAVGEVRAGRLDGWTGVAVALTAVVAAAIQLGLTWRRPEPEPLASLVDPDHPAVRDVDAPIERLRTGSDA